MIHTAFLLVMSFQGAEEGIRFFLIDIVYRAILRPAIGIKTFIAEALHRAIDVCYINYRPS